MTPAPLERVWFAHAIRGPACLLVVFTHLGQVFPTDPVEAARVGHFPAALTGLSAVPWAPVLRALAVPTSPPVQLVSCCSSLSAGS